MGASLRDYRSHPSLTGSLHMATTDTTTVTDKTDKVDWLAEIRGLALMLLAVLAFYLVRQLLKSTD